MTTHNANSVPANSMRPSRSFRSRAGFTLIEFVVALTAISIGAGIFLPAVQSQPRTGETNLPAVQRSIR